MSRALLAVALVLSLWPAAAIAYGMDRLLGDDGEPSVTARTTATSPKRAQAAARRTATAATPAPAATTTVTAPSAGADPLAELNRLREETADLIRELEVSPAASGQPDAALAGRALDVEAAIVAWQEQHRYANADAKVYAALFADIASAAADFATAPTPEAKERLDEALARHRRETLQEGT